MKINRCELEHSPLRTATPYLMVAWLALAAFLPAASAQVAPVPDAPEVPELFAPAAPGFADEFLAPRDASTLRSRRLQLNTQFFTSLPAGTTRRVRLPLFADRDYTVLLTQPEDAGLSTIGWRGRIEGYTNGHFSAVYREGAVFMRISDGRGGTFDVRPTADGGHVVVEPIPGEQGACGVQAPPAAQAKAAKDKGPANLAPSATVTYVDVLMLYTPNARINAGGPSAIQAKALQFINDANWMYSRSDTRVQLRMVSVEEINYDDSAQDLVLHRDRLYDPFDGNMDDAFARRDAVGADYICLLPYGRANSGSTLGIVDTIPGSIAVVESTQDSAVFAHELGHDLGCHHENDPDGVAYAHGYSHTESWNSGITTEERRTVMHHSWSPDKRTDYFSNPSINFTFTGNDCGGFCVNVDRPLGNVASADNARYLREVRANRAIYNPPIFYVSSAAAIGGNATAGLPERHLSEVHSTWFPRTEALASDTHTIRIATGTGTTIAGARLDKKSRLEKWGGGPSVKLVKQ